MTHLLESAREHLAAAVPDGLSLRGIARDLVMGVSCLHQYFPSRDDLLTELLVDALTTRSTPSPLQQPASRIPSKG